MMKFMTSGRNKPEATGTVDENGSLVLELRQTLGGAPGRFRIPERRHFDQCRVTIESPAALLRLLEVLDADSEILEWIRWEVTVEGGPSHVVCETRLTSDSFVIRLDDLRQHDFWLSVFITREQLREAVSGKPAPKRFCVVSGFAVSGGQVGPDLSEHGTVEEAAAALEVAARDCTDPAVGFWIVDRAACNATASI